MLLNNRVYCVQINSGKSPEFSNWSYIGLDCSALLLRIQRCNWAYYLAFLKVQGFSHQDDPGLSERDDSRYQLLTRIVGPSCLSMTAVIWMAGCVFVRLWKAEQRQFAAARGLGNHVLRFESIAARDAFLLRSERSSTTTLRPQQSFTSSPTTQSRRTMTSADYDVHSKRFVRHQKRHHISTDHRSHYFHCVVNCAALRSTCPRPPKEQQHL